MPHIFLGEKFVYNLLVSGVAWEPSTDSISTGRTFEHTNEELKNLFKPDGALDSAKLYEMPALFMTEGSGAVDVAPARVGRITRIRTNNVSHELDYVWDTEIPPIPNALIYKHRAKFGIGDFQFSRTHWSIKERDLFEVLYKIGLARRQPSQVFSLKDLAVQDDLVAVMMPFDTAYRSVYKGIQTACNQLTLECVRGDEIWENHQVMQDIVDLILKAKVIVCDLTGRNANVFYEMGIAHALGKDVIMITQNDDDVPFDVRSLRYIKYLGNAQGIKDMQGQLSARLKTLVR